MNGRDDGLVWLRDDSPALKRSRWIQTVTRRGDISAATARDIAFEQDVYVAPGDPGYVGRHHIPGDGVTTLRLMDVDGSGDVVGVRYVEDYHVTGEVSAA